ncbi:MAG: hypothetical protein HY308_14530 [Gammaproteobacteria bacterium]|nr:hypothetical protein [Gammaproteobacteria bacterium]
MLSYIEEDIKELQKEVVDYHASFIIAQAAAGLKIDEFTYHTICVKTFSANEQQDIAKLIEAISKIGDTTKELEDKAMKRLQVEMDELNRRFKHFNHPMGLRNNPALTKHILFQISQQAYRYQLSKVKTEIHGDKLQQGCTDLIAMLRDISKKMRTEKPMVLFASNCRAFAHKNGL